MRIGKIEITNYHQFKALTLDLTYPKGHAKADQCLDKVCFIGQSGTGKTSLLNMCRATFSEQFVLPDMTGIMVSGLFNGPHFREAMIEQGKLTHNYVQKVFNPPLPTALNPEDYSNKEDFLHAYYDDSMRLISFSAMLAHYSDSVVAGQAPQHLNHFIGMKSQLQTSDELSGGKQGFFDFTHEAAISLWKNTIVKDIKAYRNKELQFNQRITKALEQGIEAAQAALDEMKTWKQTTPNPVAEYARKLNPLLQEFCLEVNPDFTYTSEEDIQFIEIRHKGGQKIPFHGWSTGTLQLIFTATPLLQLNTDKAIITVDEPETSLYPDMQTKIIPFYTQLAPHAQFFFATHSPIIASCFEPWEIVELQFDERGNVVQKKYYDDTQERHVDNYRIDPRYLRWDAILQKLFDVAEEGQPERLAKLQELATINVKLKKLRQRGEQHSEEYAVLWNDYERAATLLGWSTHAQD